MIHNQWIPRCQQLMKESGINIPQHCNPFMTVSNPLTLPESVMVKIIRLQGFLDGLVYARQASVFQIEDLYNSLSQCWWALYKNYGMSSRKIS